MIQACGGWLETAAELWVGRLADACQRSVSDAASFETRIQQLRTEWRTQLGRVRANSAADLLITAIAGAPVLLERPAC
jgi:hypothetical protein